MKQTWLRRFPAATEGNGKRLPTGTRTLAGAILSIFAALTAVQALADEPACQLKEVASLKMIPLNGGQFLIPVSIQGRTFNMLPSLSSQTSAVTASFAMAMQAAVHTDDRYRVRVQDRWVNQHVTLEQIKIGNTLMVQSDFAVVPDDAVPPEAAGVIGMEYWQNFDVDLDFKEGLFDLIKPNDCEAKIVYWTKNQPTVVPIDLVKYFGIEVPLQLDGHDFDGLIEPSSGSTHLSLDVAEQKLGWSDVPPEAKQLTSGEYVYPFKTLTLGGIAVENPEILMRPYPKNNLSYVYSVSPVYIGTDILRRFHILIAYGEHKMYITPADAQ